MLRENLPAQNRHSGASGVIVLVAALMALGAGTSGAIAPALMAGVRLEAVDEHLAIEEVRLTFVSTQGVLVNDYELVVVVGSRVAECSGESLCLVVEDELVVPLTFSSEEVIERGSVWVDIPFNPSIWKNVALPRSVRVGRDEVAIIALRCDVTRLDAAGFFPQTSSGSDEARVSWFSEDGGSTWNRHLPRSIFRTDGTTLIQIEIHPTIRPSQ